MPPAILIVIPARYASVRFPAKMLASETGKPLVQHVYEAARGARSASARAAGGRLVVATDDERIASAVRGFGGEVVMTSPAHPNGTSRIAETADILALADDAIVVNAQGDEPELDPALIDAAVSALRESRAPMATIASPSPGDDPRDPNMVKVVRRLDGAALYFSRALIPHDRDRAGAAESAPLKHVGLYAYRRPFLREYVKLTETALERTEKLEQLRVLEHGFSIAVGVAPSNQSGIDTPEQYAAFVKRWRARR